MVDGVVALIQCNVHGDGDSLRLSTQNRRGQCTECETRYRLVRDSAGQYGIVVVPKSDVWDIAFTVDWVWPETRTKVKRG